MKKLLLTLGTAAATVAPLATTIACGSSAAKGTAIYAARVTNSDNLLALGYQAKYTNQTHGGDELASYLVPHAKEGFTELLHNRPPWDQTVDAENIASKGVATAFVAGFQGGLYTSLKDAGISKDNIGFSTMGETYVPDMDFRMDEWKDGMGGVDIIAAWNATEESNGDWGKARFGSTDGMDSNGNQKTLVDKDAAGKDIDFWYTSDVRVSISVTAEAVDRMTGNSDAVTQANSINGAFEDRIVELQTEAGITNETALVLKPNRTATDANEIIDPHFAWDPTVMPFMYSEDLGMGYEMPEYDSTLATVEFLEEDVDGLATDSHASVKATFAGGVDQLFFLKPMGYDITDTEIKAELQSMTVSNDITDIYVVDEDLWYQSGFGMMGYFEQMDAYAELFELTNFETGTENWGWDTIAPADLKTSL